MQEKEMALCSSILAWKTPWIEEPARLQSMGSQNVRAHPDNKGKESDKEYIYIIESACYTLETNITLHYNFF